MSGMRSGALPHRSREQPRGVSRVRTPSASRRTRAYRSIARPEGRLKSVRVVRRQSQVQEQKKYPDRLSAALSKRAKPCVDRDCQGSVKSVPLCSQAFEFEFMGGSMGSVGGASGSCGRARRIRKPGSVCLRLRIGSRPMQKASFRCSRWRRLRGPAGAQQGASAVRVDPDRPDHGRRVGIVRDSSPTWSSRSRAALIGFAGRV